MNFKVTLRFGLLFAFCCFLNTLTWGMEAASTDTPTDATTACNLSFTTEAIGVFCNEQTGLIKVHINGGTAPFKIEWDNDGMTVWAETYINGRDFTIDHLPPGNYHIKILDDYGCFLEKSQFLSGQVSTLDLSLSNNSSVCDTDGSIAVHVGNSAPPYWVIVNGPNGPQGALYNENSFAINNLPTGDYSITVRNDECENTKSISVLNAEAPLALQLSEVATRTCDGNFGSIATNITGGHAPYRLYYDGPISNLKANNSGLTHSDGAKLVQNLSPGTYKFTVIDAQMCSVNQTITVNGPSIPAVTLETESSVDVCARTGDIWITASGGSEKYILSWDNGVYRSTRITTAGYSIEDVPLGTYVISIEDEAGCTATSTIEVNTSVPDFQISAVANRGTCGQYGSISVGYPSSGSFNVEWSGPSSGSAAGGVGAYEITDLQAGTYTVSGIDQYGCARSQTVFLDLPESATMSFYTTAHAGVCGGYGAIAVNGASGTGPYQISWSGPVSNGLDALGRNYTIENLPAGTYTVLMTDAKGCSSSSTVEVVQGRAAMTFNAAASAGVCGGRGSIAISGAGGAGPYQLSWSGPVSNGLNALGRDYTIADLPSGTYTITMTDANGCSSTSSVAVGAASSDVVLATESSIDYCKQTGDIWVTPSGGSGKYTVSWSGNSQGSAVVGIEGYSIAGVAPGYYTVSITDEYGCSATNSIEVSVTRAFLEFSLAASSAVNGKDGAISVGFENGAEPHTISWAGPVSNYIRTHGSGYDIVHLPPGDYAITVTDANGCYAVDYITVPNTAGLNTLSFSATPTAQKGSTLGFIDIWIDGTGSPFTISWAGPVSDYARTDRQDYAIKNLPAGKYSITVTDRYGNYNITTVVVGSESYIQDAATGRNSDFGSSDLGLVPNATLALGQNYPNPFEGTTTIPFQLTETSEVIILVHDSFGKLIKQVQNTYARGANQFELNSNELGNGVYYYTLHAGKETATKRMIIVK